MDFGFCCGCDIDLRDNSECSRLMDNDVLSWLGNFINFLILIYITSAVVKTECFDLGQLSITVFGLVISIVISMYVALVKK